MGYRKILEVQYRTLLSNMGWIFLCFSVILLLPVLACFFYPSEFHLAQWFLYASGISFLIGYFLWKSFRKGSVQQRLTIQEGAIIVVGSWLGAILLSALPFVFSGYLPFLQAVFESTSGWTTTGLTVVDVEQFPKILLFWRSLTQFFGGAGFAIIMLSSIGGGISSGIYLAEGRMDNLLPHIKKSAKMILIIYSTYTLIGCFAYAIAGMGWFDAINHSLTALATGGFSTRTDSIGAFQSTSIEAITLVLMTLGATGFGIHFLAWQRDWNHLKKCAEPYLYLAILAFVIPMVFLSLSQSIYSNLSDSLRHSVFQGISALTGTGFSTSDLVPWPGFSLFILVVLMIFGGMMDSTSGGVKLFRLYVVFQVILSHIQSFFLPKGTVQVKVVWKGNKKFVIQDFMIKSILVFLCLYFITLGAGVGVLLWHGNSLQNSLFEFTSALSTVGLSVGITRSDAPPLVLIAQTIGMFLGRLEFLVVIFGLSKVVRDTILYVTYRNKKKRGKMEAT